MSTWTNRRAPPVDLQAAGVAVGPAVADAEHEVGRQQGGVAVAVRGLQADHAGLQRVVVGDDAPAHQGRDDRHPGQLGELDQQLGGVGVDDAAAGDDQRPLGVVEQVQRLLDLGAGGGRPVDRPAARRCRGRTRSRSAGRRRAGRSGPGRAGPSASGGTPAGRRPGPGPPPARSWPSWSPAWRWRRCRPPGSPPCGSRATGAWPVMHRIGMESPMAEYSPVIMSVPAGPEVPTQTPMLPARARV